MTDLTQPHIVCHLHAQRCAYCNAEQSYSHVYICETERGGKKMKPLTSPSQAEHLPAVIMTMPVRSVPFCHLCLAGRPERDDEAHARWAETLRRKRTETSAPSGAHVHPFSAKPRNTSIDDLE